MKPSQVNQAQAELYSFMQGFSKKYGMTPAENIGLLEITKMFFIIDLKKSIREEKHGEEHRPEVG